MLGEGVVGCSIVSLYWGLSHLEIHCHRYHVYTDWSHTVQEPGMGNVLVRQYGSTSDTQQVLFIALLCGWLVLLAGLRQPKALAEMFGTGVDV